MTDEHIITLFWNRDERAIKETDLRYGRYLYTVSYNILHDSGDCEECKNSTYLGVWNAVPPDRPIALRAYLTQMIRRISINRYKEKNREKRVPSELTDSLSDLSDFLHGGTTPEEAFDAAELGKAISTFLFTRPKRERHIFLARYYYADSIKEIAKQVGLSESSIFKILAVMRGELKTYLEKEGYEL